MGTVSSALLWPYLPANLTQNTDPFQTNVSAVVNFFISGYFYFSFVSTSLAYITIPKNRRKRKIAWDKKLSTTYLQNERYISEGKRYLSDLTSSWSQCLANCFLFITEVKTEVQ